MLTKLPIIIPKGIRYIGDWEEFRFSNFPKKCIIDKKLPGCGFTEYCIKSHENVILCSPRKILLQNKYDQHPDKVFLVKNELDQDPGVDINLENKKPGSFKLTSQMMVQEDPDIIAHRTGIIKTIQENLRFYLSNHVFNAKILVTYDSFWIIKKFLEELGIYSEFFVIIDEFQSVLQDARFKPSTEIGFLSELKNSEQSIFVSATPMLDDYIDELDDFKRLPYYEFDWESLDPGRVIKPSLTVKLMRSPGEKIKEIINKFRITGHFSEAYFTDQYGNPGRVQSREAVFYVNSVDQIIQSIKSCNLDPGEVNILCSNTEYNQKKIWQKLGKRNGYDIGRVPLLGEPRKPFTFCTRTVYLGADFYSDNAVSYIFSDSNSRCLAVDISLDLPQILGRQRLDSNPWRNEATLFYRTTADFRKMTKEEFQSILNEKISNTKKLLIAYNESSVKEAMIMVFESQIGYRHYELDYMSFDKARIHVTRSQYRQDMNVVFNKLVYLADKRAFDVQQHMYSNRFMVFRSIDQEFGGFNDVLTGFTEFFEEYKNIKKISDRLKYLCEFSLQSTKEVVSVVLDQIPETDIVKKYFVLGPERCKAYGYNVTRLNKELGVTFFSKEILKSAIYYQFKEGDRYSVKDIKELLRQIYDTVSYQKLPKATDIEEFFEVRKCQVTDSQTKKRSHGFELIRKLLPD